MQGISLKIALKNNNNNNKFLFNIFSWCFPKKKGFIIISFVNLLENM